jgi:pimeloyl-ACP methyl ester carboxylesterase
MRLYYSLRNDQGKEEGVSKGGLVTQVGVKDELLNAQTLRAIGVAPYGGGDVAECLATVSRVDQTDLSSWYDQWTATANSVLEQAESALAAGDVEGARLAFFRASNYYRTGGVMLMGTPVDSRLVHSNHRQTEAFRRGAALLASPPEILEIPYEDTTLPGYYFRVDDDPRPRPTIILLGGYDGTAEELYFLNGAAALARGYNVLAFDGPGQGGALLRQGLLLRPDFDKVVTPVVDFALSRPDVDPEQLVLLGLSLGFFLGARAASGEHRLAACILDCGSFDMFANALERMPAKLAAGFAARNKVSTLAVGRILAVLAKKPTAGWALRRGQQVHGVRTPVDFVQALREFTLAGYGEKITCPTLVCNAEGDDISASAPKLFDVLQGDKQLITFTSAEGAGDHCEAGARTLFHLRAFSWLDAILQPRV